MSTKYDASLIQDFKRTAALAKKLAKPLTITIHIPEWCRRVSAQEAKAVGVTLDEFFGLILSGGWRANGFDPDFVLEDFRDDTETEEEAPR